MKQRGIEEETFAKKYARALLVEWLREDAEEVGDDEYTNQGYFVLDIEALKSILG